MSLYLVCYDIREPEWNYQGLHDRLASLSAVRLLETVWIVKSTGNSGTIRDDLRKQIFADDRLVVAALCGDAAWCNLKGTRGQAFRSWLEGK